jgi:alpha-ribazole phosphatase
MSLILLRHTRPALAAGMCYGRSDLDLDTCFAESAEAVVAGLPEFARIVTSPLGRCRRLAERIALARDLPLETDARIAEMDFGRWEGVPWAEVPKAELDAWALDFEGARPHGGESVAMLAARVRSALADLAPEPTLWVTHSGVVRAVSALTAAPGGWNAALDFGSWVVLDPRPSAPE